MIDVQHGWCLLPTSLMRDVVMPCALSTIRQNQTAPAFQACCRPVVLGAAVFAVFRWYKIKDDDNQAAVCISQLA